MRLKISDIFDRSDLKIKEISKRKNELTLKSVLPLQKVSIVHPTFNKVAFKIKQAKSLNASMILMMGAHVIRSGVQRYIIDLMEKEYISCISMNGACVIHDYEFALINATTESVASYIKDGHFGFWKETGRINDIVNDAYKNDMGIGYAVGSVIENEKFPHHQFSVLAAGYRLGIPVTVHVGIGCDIVHQFPNCNGSAYGHTSYIDFLKFTKVMEKLEKGVVMNFGSSVMAPEVYLKALSMVRNSARQYGRIISDFTTLVCDLVDLPSDYEQEPSKDNPLYYFRPWKTMLVRTVSDGGESYYIKGTHAETIPQLWSGLNH